MAARKTSARKAAPKNAKAPAAKQAARRPAAPKKAPRKTAAAKKPSRKTAATADAATTLFDALIVWRNWTMLDSQWRALVAPPDEVLVLLEAIAAALGLDVEQLLLAPRPNPGRVLVGVERELAELQGRSPELAKSGLAAAALALAGEIDHPENSATAKSACARQLRETLDRLRDLAPPAEETDELEQLRARRDDRLQGRAAT